MSNSTNMLAEAPATNGHPKGLYVLFATEMWERFNYYGMRAILILFMTKALMFDKAFASNLYGSYTGLVYLTPLIGGFISDRFWGNQRSIIVGGLLMAIGEFVLFGCASLYQSNSSLATMLFFSGLGFMIAGNGFFKPNISSMVGQLYPNSDRRKDAAYTIFYMGINLGGAIGPIVCGLLGDTGNPLDFKWAFLAGGIAMLISVLVQLVLHTKYVKGPDGEILGMTPAQVKKQWLNPIYMAVGLLAFTGITIAILYADAKVFPFLSYLLLAAVLFIGYAIFSDKALSKIEKERLIVVFVASFFVVFFWSAFEQAGASLNFFADEQTQRDLGFWTIPASLFQSLNSIFVVSFAPIFALVWVKLGKNEPAALTKMAIGLLLLCVGYIIIGFGVKDVSPGIKVSFMWLTSMYALHTWGELCLSPIGLSLVNKLSPFRLASLMMAVWFLANAAANKFAGVLSGYYPEEQTKEASFTVATKDIRADSTTFEWGSLTATRNAPVSGMAWEYKASKKAEESKKADTITQLTLVTTSLNYVNINDSFKAKRIYPEVLRDKELERLKEVGKQEPKFVSHLLDGGKKLGILREGENGVNSFEIWNLYPEKKFFLGYKLNTLYDFFMLFVVMSGMASIILFALSKRLQKLMHGVR
ncbi:MAG: MFS transporter [Bacteroidetes bacterium]|nr:MAG: MFS transporter [Bacteroidota bacterium]